MQLRFILLFLIVSACSNSGNNDLTEQKPDTVVPIKQDIKDTIFKKKVIVILTRDPEPKSHHINIQDYVKNGISFIPVFTSQEEFNRLTSGQVSNPVTEIDGLFLLSILNGSETLKVNPGSDNETSFKADELIRHYAAEIASINRKIRNTLKP